MFFLRSNTLRFNITCNCSVTELSILDQFGQPSIHHSFQTFQHLLSGVVSKEKDKKAFLPADQANGSFMIKEIRVEDWKSFESSTLYVDPLTVLIGTNASGKSNVMDALLFLNLSASSVPLNVILQGDSNFPGLRGSIDWVCRSGTKQFALEVKASGSNELIDYIYRLEVNIEGLPQIASESLRRVKYRPGAQAISSDIFLFKTDDCGLDAPAITARLYNRKQGKPRPSARQSTILSQLHPEAFSQNLSKDITEGVEAVIGALTSIFILDPIPSHMRNYAPLSKDLDSDAANMAGIIAALDVQQKQHIEETLTKHVSLLPEKDIGRIYSETVGRFKSDAMLYCDELWGDKKISVDARGMSDGTLRFLAILVALLTRPEHSLLVVEEIDNGLHPSRSNVLLSVLRSIGEQRHIDILVTTHNPALLDSLGPEMTPFITISHRDSETGHSRLTLLEDLSKLPKLLAIGPVGTLSSQGKLEQALRQEQLSGGIGQ
ncbi:AAA family ATPase [Endozoicomonas sp. ALC020]